MSFIKIPPPRQLMQNESLDSLDHWKTNFRTFFRRDTVFKKFLVTSFHWNPSQTNYGLQAQGDMTAEDLKEALVDFLSTLAGFLPHSYLTSKLVEETKNLEECWQIIYEHYNVQITPETSLDFENLKKEPAENYRQFFERLLQHSKLHLAPKNSKVGNLVSQEDETRLKSKVFSLERLCPSPYSKILKMGGVSKKFLARRVKKSF